MSQGPKSVVELRFRCSGLKKMDLTSESDPIVVAFLLGKGGEMKELGRTEVVRNNGNPEFATTISVEFFFEEVQNLRFEVFDSDDKASIKGGNMIGVVTCTLGEIMGQPGSRLVKDVTHPEKAKKRGAMMVSALEVADPRKKVTIKLRAEKLDKKDTFGKSDPFFKVIRQDRVAESTTETLVYQSEVVKVDLSPKWEPFTESFASLVGHSADGGLKIEIYDWDARSDPDLIGIVETSFSALHYACQSKQALEVVHPRKKAQGPSKLGFNLGSLSSAYTHSGLLFVEQFEIINPSFADYLRGNFDISLSVAIDFTGSNGDPSSVKSLHHIGPKPNAYQEAIRAVGDIISCYDSEKKFTSFLFGGMDQKTSTVSHCFPLNGDTNDPTCHGVDAILEAYKARLEDMLLSGPTNFAEVITMIISSAEHAQQQNLAKYFVLLIITDGEVTDFEETKEAIVTASSLPMSVIIIGVGKENFKKMIELDADKKALKDRKGRAVKHDIVQFVEFRKYEGEGGQARLTTDVLAEVPRQFMEYCVEHKVPVPAPPPPPALE